MTATTSTASAILRPEDVGDLLIDPVVAASVATRTATVVTTSSSSFRIPLILEDPSADWVNEGEEIPTSDADFDELTITPSKLAGLTIISRELADDSSPEAAEVVGAGLARDIARKLDAAYLGDLSAPAPKGLASLADGDVTAVEAPAEWEDVTPFTAAQYAAEGTGSAVAAWLMHPDDALALASLTEGGTSIKPLLGPDVTQAGRRTIGGVPVLTSPAATAGTVYGLDPRRVFVVIRDDAEVTTDRSVFFTSDRVAVRATMRVGLGFPQPKAIVRIVRATD